MVEVEIVPYNAGLHFQDLYDMYIGYGIWLDSEVLKHYGIHLITDGNVKQLTDNVIQSFTTIKPPEGIIYILEEDGKAAGMVRLDTLQKGIGEVHNVYTRPEYRRRGYSTLLMTQIEKTALEFGFSALRLDTGGFNIPAQRLYQKLGYKMIERYTSVDPSRNEVLRRYYKEKWYMEKKL